MKKSSTLRVWTDVNSLLRTHKLINFGLILACLLAGNGYWSDVFCDPIVVVREGNKQQYLAGYRASFPISEEVVEEFVEEFLLVRYEWDKFDPQTKKRSLSPIVTDGL